MGDSTAMTIEFLRARLLSERSISRTARQRADQLAKRVVELEQQLRIVTIQRKRAEKAAAEVLSILESPGVGDSSEMIDSSSDQGEVCDGPVRGEVTLNEEEIYEGSRMGRSEAEDRLSGSELDVSPSQGKSLSWKSYGSNPDSHEKERVKQTRERQRRSSFRPMVDSSSMQHMAKSCRSAAEDEADKPVLGAYVNGEARLAGCSDDQPDVLRDASRNEAKEVFMNTSVQCSLDPSKESNAHLYDNGGDRDEEMEKVLEHQAQLIGQFQAEENAQREWEEKYNENQSSIMGFPGLGSEPGKAENNTEPKKEAVELSGENPYHEEAKSTYHEEAKSRTTMLSSSQELTAPSPLGAFVPDNQELHETDQEKCGSSKEATAPPNYIVPTNLTTNQSGSSYNPSSDGLLAGQFDMLDKGIKSSYHELVFSVKEGSERTANGKQNQFPFLVSSDASSHSNAIRRPNVDGFLESPSNGTPSSNSSSARFSRWRSSNILLHRPLPQASGDSLGDVLEGLQHAKTSLHQLNKAPSNQDTLAIAASSDSQLQGIHYNNMLGIPIGSAGLFRLPTRSFTQANSSHQKLDASSLRLAAIRPDVEYATGGNDCHYPMTSCVEAGPRVSVGKQYFDPFIASEIDISAPGMYSLPSSGIVRKRMPSHDGFASPYLDIRNEMPSERQYLYDGHSRWPDMRRF